MKLIATSDFKHGRLVFQKGKLYDVPPEFGGYFRANGWARDPKADDPADAKAEPFDVRMLDANAPVPKPAAEGEVQTLTVEDVKKVSADDLLGATKKP